MTKRIEVETYFGELYAQVNDNPTYPGITVGIVKDADDGIGVYERQMILADCTPEEPEEGVYSLIVRLWESEENEEYTRAITFYEEKEPEPSGSIWGKYRSYLAAWIMEHQDVENYGKSPPTFEEWEVDEYKEG